jgi:hypothetical protein
MAQRVSLLWFEATKANGTIVYLSIRFEIEGPVSPSSHLPVELLIAGTASVLGESCPPVPSVIFAMRSSATWPPRGGALSNHLQPFRPSVPQFLSPMHPMFTAPPFPQHGFNTSHFSSSYSSSVPSFSSHTSPNQLSSLSQSPLQPMDAPQTRLGPKPNKWIKPKYHRNNKSSSAGFNAKLAALTAENATLKAQLHSFKRSPRPPPLAPLPMDPAAPSPSLPTVFKPSPVASHSSPSIIIDP